MAQLLISAAVNIGAGLLLNALFPPPDIEQEGPRLTDLGFTSAAYGKFINITFGTDRIDGNIIDSTDPPIEEVVNTETQSAGKGGGQQVSTTTYTYFLTCRIAFCIEGASDLIRLWGDGKMIYDATGTTQLLREGTGLTFYPGGPTQIQDPEEVSRRDSDIPAYRHLTSIKLDRMALADFGNRIPNFTAEIAFDSDVTTPIIGMDEPAGIDIPGSASGADTSHMAFDATRNYLISLKRGSDSTWTADASSLDFVQLVGSGGLSNPGYGFNGYVYAQTSSGNTVPLQKKNIETGEVEQQFGADDNSLGDDTGGFENSGSWTALNIIVPGVGVKNVVAHTCSFSFQDGSLVDGDDITNVFHIFGSGDGIPNQAMDDGVMIPDHDRGVFYFFTPNDSQGRYEIFQIDIDYTIGVNGGVASGATVTKLRNFTRGSTSDDFNGTGEAEGWAVNRSNGDLILSNGTTIVLYNPISDTVLAKRQTTRFFGRNNYYSGSIFAYGRGTSSAGAIEVVDTRDLSLVKSIDTTEIDWPDSGTGNGVIHPYSCVWDDRVGALFLSRENPGTVAADPYRIVKIFVNRVEGLGVGLDYVVQSLSTSYQRQVMAGLDESDIDVTTLAGDTVLGYTINKRSTMKAALEPLRQRYFFDGVQSDWQMKFPKRGQAAVLTIPEEHVGVLKRGRSESDEPPVSEIRQDDLALPMRLAVRYKNKDNDYQVDYEHDKRHLTPNPTMRSKTESTVDIPIVSQPTAMKQTAQKQLYTLWTERVSYKTVIPWTYIKLDATDVFNLGVFGETAQLRMAENDLGAGWAVGITGVVEDTKSFTSTLGGGTGLGHIGINVPSGLPTRLIPLDAPLLSANDILLTPISNAYMAVSGYESSWPGTTVSKSIDDVTYNTTGTANVEVPVAAVKTPPGAWNYVNGDFPNRIQEVEDGGSMVITPIRGRDFWASTTETNMLAGYNTIAVVGSDDEVEVLSFIDVTDNGDNTFTLERLLRGRLGTEDIADGGMTAGSQIVGLQNSTGTKQDGGIIRQKLTLDLLDTSVFFKGVTVGTLLEDATAISHTYTGRDLKPYAPTHARTTLQTSFYAGEENLYDNYGGLTVTWDRRTRGPLQGEWLDGSGTVPLNETIEQYEVTLHTDAAGDFITKTVNNTTQVSFSNAELADGLIEVPLTVVNGDAESTPGGEWVTDTGSVTRDTDNPFEGTRQWGNSADNAQVNRIYQDISIPSANESDVDTGNSRVRLMWNQGRRLVHNDDVATMWIEFYDGGMVQLGSTHKAPQIGLPDWTLRSLEVDVPTNTRTVRIFMHTEDIDVGGADNDKWDFITLMLVPPAYATDQYTAKVTQISETGKRSPQHVRTVVQGY